MNKQILIIIIFAVFVIIGLIFTKKCATHFDSIAGKQTERCYYIWQKDWWKQGEKTILNNNNNINDNNMQKNSVFLNFYTDYINLTPNHVKIGEEFFIRTPGIEVKLLDVLDDGRCPADADCFHSGWATVLVEVSYNGVIEEKELHIRGGNANVFRGPEETSNELGSGNVISIDQFKIFLVALNPYPVTTKKFEKTEYEGIFLADTLESLKFKKEIVGIASDELRKHLTDSEKYSAIEIVPDGSKALTNYTVTFNIPFSSVDQSVWVRVGYINNQSKATDFISKNNSAVK
jgi:hypothetical protein